MFSIRNILSASLLLTLLTSTWAQNQEELDDVVAFRQLLDQVDPPSLHEALHNYSPKKFQHGMFQEDRTAVEVIHKTEPSLATSIINLAKRTNNDIKPEFVKRQDIANGTTPATTSADNSPEPATSHVNPVAPIATPSSPEATSAAAPVAVATTSTAANGSPVVGSFTPSPTSAIAATSSPISLTAGEVITSTNGVGLLVVSTVGGGVRTVTPSKGSTPTTNIPAGVETSVAFLTTSLPNGSQSVVTAVTLVTKPNEAGATPSGTAGVGTTSTGSSPGLQTGDAAMTRRWGREMLCVVGGAVVVAGML